MNIVCDVMGFIGNVIAGAKKAIPVLAAKVGTVLLFFITIGFFAGFFIAKLGYNWLVLLVPLISMAVMWKKLDEGFLVLILLIVLVIWAMPEIFMS